MARIPKNHRLAERKLIKLVETGEWYIKADGSIWTEVRRGGRWAKPCASKRVEKKLESGYLMVRSMQKGRRICGLAHRLVWQHFFGNIPAGKTINHDNGIKDDNRPTNLEVATYSEQLRHAYRTGLKDEHGETNPAAKLTDNQVGQIRQAYACRTHNMQQLADLFGVRFQHISRLIRGTRRTKQGGVTFDTDLRHNSSSRDPNTGRFAGAA